MVDDKKPWEKMDASERAEHRRKAGELADAMAANGERTSLYYRLRAESVRG